MTRVQPSLSKASDQSSASSSWTRGTGPRWRSRCSSQRTSPPSQLCSHSVMWGHYWTFRKEVPPHGRKNCKEYLCIGKKALHFYLNSWHLDYLVPIWSLLQTCPPCWDLRWCERLLAAQWLSPPPPPQQDLPVIKQSRNFQVRAGTFSEKICSIET